MRRPNAKHEEQLHVRKRQAAARTESASEAVASVQDSLDLSPEEIAAWLQTIERRREFCLEMAEFFGNLCTAEVLDPQEATLLRPLIDIFENAANTFSRQDPARAPEQCHEWELCLNSAAEFFAIEDETGETLQEMCKPVYGVDSSMWRALAEALIIGQLHGWKDWKLARNPIGWVNAVSADIHKDHCPLSMEEEPGMSSLDALTPTGDPYAALLRDPSGDRLASEIHAKVDLVNACEREGLARETSQLALGRYNGVPLSVTAEVLGLSKRDLAAATREMVTAKPALQTRLATYRREEAETQVKQI